VEGPGRVFGCLPGAALAAAEQEEGGGAPTRRPPPRRVRRSTLGALDTFLRSPACGPRGAAPGPRHHRGVLERAGTAPARRPEGRKSGSPRPRPPPPAQAAVTLADGGARPPPRPLRAARAPARRAHPLAHPPRLRTRTPSLLPRENCAGRAPDRAHACV